MREKMRIEKQKNSNAKCTGNMKLLHSTSIYKQFFNEPGKLKLYIKDFGALLNYL